MLVLGRAGSSPVLGTKKGDTKVFAFFDGVME